MPGTLFVVATPIGNLEDVSARALRILREVTLIAAEDTRRTAQLLARYAITTPTTSLHEHNEGRKTNALVERLRRGESIALVSDAGTPTVSDPGRQLIRGAIEAGGRVESIPGPSAALAALTTSGLPAETFTFLGFPPTRTSDRSRWFDQLRTAGRTVVFFEAPHRIRQTLEELLRNVGDVPIALGRELTKAHEETIRGTVSAVIGMLTAPKGEFTAVVDVGQLPQTSQDQPKSDEDIGEQFGELTNLKRLTRRAAVSELSRRFRIPAREVYAAIERSKKSVE